MSTTLPPLEAPFDGGWMPIYHRLAERLAAIDPGLVITEAKDKIGRLKVRVTIADKAVREQVRELIAEAAEESAHTCVRCGAPGEPTRIHVWIFTVCPACAEFTETTHGRRSYAIRDVRHRLAGIADGAPVLMETGDGELVEVAADPGVERVRAVTVDGGLRWIRADAESPGEPLGGVVDAVVLKVYQDPGEPDEAAGDREPARRSGHTVEWIIEHQEEIAARFENWEPSADDERAPQ
ncbi:hypothetical protein KIH27_02185 [Mycobacterium sp. M1]|uniref:Uncharacterized protein n=1 Tax=Mycolicibacter acidiphilus TaxID=2835306 RepID=A0ABS5RDY4_9MYCO|nr:hypothetical protein [Mycolicibacter acidiphilus]MBS9532394.1 hypothetical protein [Mycolicibacter acidiphilus]